MSPTPGSTRPESTWMYLGLAAALVFCTAAAAEGPALRVTGATPSGEAAPTPLAGLVEVESRDGRVVVVLDRSDLEVRSDGLADLVVVLGDEGPVEDLSFSGQALVEVHPHHLRIVPMGLEEPLVLGVRGRFAEGSAPEGTDLRLGTSLVFHRDLPPLTLREARTRVLDAPGPQAGPRLRDRGHGAGEPD